MSIGTRSLVAALLGVAITQSGVAQGVDRSRRPAAPPTPSFVFPTARAQTLPNGLVVEVVENHALQLVAVRAIVQGGPLLDPTGKAGTFALDTLLLRDGTTTRSGEQLAETIDETGAPLTPTQFTTVTDQFDRSLDLMGDMLMHPSFPL